MKINKISMAIIAAATMLSLCPTIHAQDTDTNKPAAETPRARRAMSPEAELARIDKAVTLTDDEKPKVKAAVEEYSKAMQDAASAEQDDRRTKMRDAREAFDKKIKGILTEDQYTKFQAMPRRGGRRGANGGGAGGANGGGAGQ